MSDSNEKIEIKRGRKDVYFDHSKVCFIDGRAGELRYRGYSIDDLAERSSFEETCHLLQPTPTCTPRSRRRWPRCRARRMAAPPRT